MTLSPFLILMVGSLPLTSPAGVPIILYAPPLGIPLGSRTRVEARTALLRVSDAFENVWASLLSNILKRSTLDSKICLDTVDDELD